MRFLAMVPLLAVVPAALLTGATTSGSGYRLAPARAALTVDEAVVATAIEERQPQGAATSFPATVGRLFYWNRISGAEGPTPIHHVWYRGEEEVARVALTINGPSWRTWSSKEIPAEWAGSWRVDVVAGEEVLHRTEFAVR